MLLLVLSALAFATPGSVETKEELSLRLLGKLPTTAVEPEQAAAPASKAPAASKVQALPTVALPTVAASQAVPAAVDEAAQPAAAGPQKDIVNQVVSLPTVPSTNEQANEQLREQALSWGKQGSVTPEVTDATTLTDTQITTQSEGFSSVLPWWLPAVLFGGFGLFALSRRPGGLGQLTGAAGPAPMRVLSRTALGQNSGLALLELDAGEGETRRILVGFGGGAPNLVTDLTPAKSTTTADEAPVLHVVPDPVIERPSVDSFDFSAVAPRVPSVPTTNAPLPRDEAPEPAMSIAPPAVESTSGRRSVLSARSNALRPPTFSNDESFGFAATFKQEMEKPVKKRSADEARALVDEVLAERDPAAGNDGQRRSRPWAGTRFEGTA